MKHIFITLSLFLCCVTTRLYSAELPAIQKLNNENGLSSNFIMDITQDKQGFLWIATESGLNKFDGKQFTTYKKDNTEISSNQLNKILSDPDKNIIWIATQRDGLCAFNYATESFTVYKAVGDNVNTSINTNDITDLKLATDGGIWISTYHRGINYYNSEKGEFIHYFADKIEGLGGKKNWTAIDDKKGNLYIGHSGNSGMSIISLKDYSYKNYLHNPKDPHSLPGNDVRTIFMDANNHIWVGTNNGLALFNPQTEKFITFRHNPKNSSSLISDYVNNITQTQDGRLCISTNPGGISILDLNSTIFLDPEKVSFQHIIPTEDQYGLSSGNIRCVYQDTFNNLWIGSYGGGINFISYDESPFHNWQYTNLPTHKNSLSGKQTQGLCVDHTQKIWIGNNGSIDLYHNNKIAPFDFSKITHIDKKQVQAIYEDSNKNIWFGINQNDVTVYMHKQNRFIHLSHPEKKGINVNCFFEENNTETMWIGTQTGVYIYKHGKYIDEAQAINDKLPDLMIRSIAFDKSGNLWIGTFGKGVCVLDKDLSLKWNFVTENGFCSNAVSHLFCDSKQRMWVGTREGLALFSDTEKETYTIFKEENGLEDNHIRAIIEDEQGDIWFSTNSGISCYKAQKETIDNFNYLDDIPFSDFMDGAAAKDAKGTLYFGSQNGICYFNPIDFSTRKTIAPVVITQLNTYVKQKQGKDKETPLSIFKRKITLPYKQNTFRISYNVLNYAQNKQIEYAYILEGLENSWYNMQHENHATFRNLPPGKYTFKIKARIRNQEWGEPTDKLVIQIHPPIWLSWWAKLIYILLFLCIVYLIICIYKRKINFQSQLLIEKRNNQKKQELNQERLRFYTNITHELRTPLTLILGPLEDLSEDNSLSSKHLNKIKIIHQSASRLLDLINQILEFRKTETQNKKLCVDHSNIANLVQEIGLRYKELNLNDSLIIHTSIDTEHTLLYFDPEIITTILNNLLTNAIKYTKEGQITLTLRSVNEDHKEYTEIEVKDTGFGISGDTLPHIFERYYQVDGKDQASGSGIGLALVKNLVILHEGTITAESELNEGSTFRLRLLTNNTYPHAKKRHKIETKQHEVAKTESSPNNHPILLVVEDNIEIGNYIKESLSDAYNVITSINGKEGCEQAFTHIPDIIVSDIMMPEMDGIELCKLLKEDIRTSHIPIILLTAKSSLPDKTEGYQAGADSYITKPFSANLLQTRIINLLESRKRIAKSVSPGSPQIQKEDNDSLSKLDNEFLKKLNRIIEENIDAEKIDITFISDKMCMSHSTLYRKIKGLTEMSANEYIRKVKFQHAKRLLLTREYTITEISYMIGISSVTYFRQCFKEEFGATPTEYLKQNE